MATDSRSPTKASGTKVFLGVCLVIVLLVLLGAIIAQSVLPADRLPTLEAVKVQTELPAPGASRPLPAPAQST